MSGSWEADPYTPTNTGNAFIDTGRWGEAPTFTENTWWNRNFGDLSDFRNDGSSGGPSTKDLVNALGQVAKTANDKPADKAPPMAAIPQIAPAGQPMRRVAIDQLAQLLNKRRDDLLAGVMKPGGQAEPYVTPHSIGLLGF
jgi:hypothetical protein